MIREKPLKVLRSVYLDVEDAEFIEKLVFERDMKRNDILRGAIKTWINMQKSNADNWPNNTRQL